MRIGNREIGPGKPALLIAEAGVNHNGDLETAHKLVDAAADAGADCVKFQTWITDNICAPGAGKAAYQNANSPQDDDQYAMLKRLELPFEWHFELKEHCRQRGILFLSTPDDIQSAEFLVKLGVPALKVGSAELTNLPHLRRMAQMGLPLILSTGMADLQQVRSALTAVAAANPVEVALLHCVSAYPAPEEEMNLRAIHTLRNEFGVPVGLSDHTEGDIAPVTAVGIGMEIWEKHITLDRNLPGPDHAASIEPHAFKELVHRIRRAEKMLGTGIKQPSRSETSTQQAVRRVLLYTMPLEPGAKLREDHLAALRTGHEGLGVEETDALIGRVLARHVQAGEPAAWEDFTT
jgi:N-acetylneuraminate synthase/N,N'-diacetyllegionaminate synthase